MEISPAQPWRTRVSRYRLIGLRCKSCGRTHYPPQPACPYCGSSELEEVQLPRRGTLVSYTIVYSVSERYRNHSPLVVGRVRLDDGTVVDAPLTDIADPSSLKTGMRVEAVFRRITEDGRYGVIVYGVKFRPVIGSV